MSELGKVTDEHRARRAVVYVRQSTPGQVERNTESAQRQYALVKRAVALGWAADSVLVVDEDQGRSGSSSASRIGFCELVADVGLGRVGMVLALEVSRLARSSADWHQLLDLCALTGTLIADADGVYAPGHFNDRLLLGLKGTMSEAELHLSRSRLRGGLENKARRGELRVALPVGLERDDDGRIVLCRDEQVRAAIEHVFYTWRRCGSARQVVAELAAQQMRLPRRRVGERRIRWEPASYGAVHDVLTNPAYAGAFVFGRTRQRKTVGPDGRIRVHTERLPLEQWSVCLPDHHPGYVSWSDYLATLQRLQANVIARGEGGGAAREGRALLQGILRCGRCGRRLSVRYSGPHGTAVRYICDHTYRHQGTALQCQSLGGLRADEAIAAHFLDAVTPAAVQATAAAIDELEAQHEGRLRQQRLAVEGAQFEADRVRRQFDACEPENRLVARTLETTFEQALHAVEHQRRRLQDIERQRPQPLTDPERLMLTRLASDLPRLWNAATTTDRDRKELLRTVIRETVVVVHRDEHYAELEVHWHGGARTTLRVRLNRSGRNRNATPTDLTDLIAKLAAHHTDAEIAKILSAQGRSTPTGLPFNARRVADIRQRAGVPVARPQTPTANSSRSTRPPASSASAPRRSAAGWPTGSCPASRPHRTPHGASASATTSARASSPTSPTATSAYATQLASSASRARRSSTRSSAANATPSTSPKAAAAAYASSFTPTSRACSRPPSHDQHPVHPEPPHRQTPMAHGN
jgi:DNA invertase Pin-like site-specific DNA recombinase